MLSEHYKRSLAEAREHHLSSKTYSGKFLRPHAPAIKKLIEDLGCTSILDYGCGKGAQYEWVSHGGDASIPEGMTIEQYWGIPVTKYDPAYPPFAAEPEGAFDLVICTHVLGSIPAVDLRLTLYGIFEKTRKALYVAEKIGPVRKEVFSQPEHQARFNDEGWYSALREAWEDYYMQPDRRADPLHGGDAQVWLATRQRTENHGVINRLVQVAG